MLSFAKRYDAAIETALAAIERDPESYIAHYALQSSYELAGHYAEAIATGHAALAISGRHPWALAMLAATYADWDRPSEARAVHGELVARAAEAYVQPTVLAWSAASAGLNDDAVKLVEQAVQERDPFLMLVLKHWPSTESLRQTLREAGTFDATLRRLGIA